MSPPQKDAARTKDDARHEARALRLRLAGACPDHAARLASFAPLLNAASGAVVGGYAALPGEADPAQLLAALEQAGCRIAWPRVASRDRALDFHEGPADGLMPGRYGVPEPSPDWPPATPGIVLVPLLAFDKDGFRLGYGGGYYDRTLSALGGVPAIGIAFAGQRVAMLPREPHDMPLAAILTEQGFHRFAP